jgi:hypothetical protein
LGVYISRRGGGIQLHVLTSASCTFFLPFFPTFAFFL